MVITDIYRGYLGYNAESSTFDGKEKESESSWGGGRDGDQAEGIQSRAGGEEYFFIIFVGGKIPHIISFHYFKYS